MKSCGKRCDTGVYGKNAVVISGQNDAGHPVTQNPTLTGIAPLHPPDSDFRLHHCHGGEEECVRVMPTCPSRHIPVGAVIMQKTKF